MKRVCKRYDEEGDAGLVHLSRGRQGNRRKPPEIIAFRATEWGGKGKKTAHFALPIRAAPYHYARVALQQSPILRTGNPP